MLPARSTTDRSLMTTTPPPRHGLAAKLPIIVIAVIAVAGFVFLRKYMSFDLLAENRADLIEFRDTHYLVSVLGFIATYALIVSFSLPGATLMTLTGGFLFGLFPGVAFNIIAATLGAIAIFSAARMGFGESLSRRIEGGGGAAARLQAALRENEWSMLFIMRLVPVVPFVLANLIPAFTGTKLARFAISTFIGIIPGALVYTSVGSGLGAVFARGAAPDLSILWQPHIIGPILGLAALSALPIFLKRRTP
jgi:uncharacterized membrane protein YdjX (TVP38/TMEM64 family)